MSYQQPYQPYQPYQPPPPQPYYVPPQTSGLATASLIFGIISWVVLPLLGAIIAIICGHAAKSEIRASGGRLTGDGSATIGLVLGYIQLILACLGGCAWGAFMIFSIVMSSQSGYY